MAQGSGVSKCLSSREFTPYLMNLSSRIFALRAVNCVIAEPSNTGGKMRKLIVAFIGIILCHLSLLAQNDHAMLSGTVSDQANSRIPAAKIVVKSEATGVEYDAVS